MRTFNEMVSDELVRARMLHPQPVANLHDGYGRIAEEFDAFWDEVKQPNSRRRRQDLLMELVQVAAMCRRVAEDCGLLDQLIDLSLKGQKNGQDTANQPQQP